MSESFGARLRARRESAGLALAAISDDLKIKPSLLEAVERDDVSHWPSGIYRRAFIRAYAQAIGLNPDEIVREFVELYPDPDELFGTSSPNPAAADNAWTGAGPPTRLRHIMDSAIGSLSKLRRGPLPEPAVAGPAPVAATSRPEPVAYAAPDPPARPGPVVQAAAVPAPPPSPDFLALAHLCTGFCRVSTADDLPPLLAESARILHAIGLIVWLWDPAAEELKPALVHGYSDKVLAQLPAVSRDADNATAAAFRSARPCAIRGNEHNSGALVVPLMQPDGCAGVLAIEVQDGLEATPPVHAAAMIVAAALAPLVARSAPIAAPSGDETRDADGADTAVTRVAPEA